MVMLDAWLEGQSCSGDVIHIGKLMATCTETAGEADDKWLACADRS